MEAPVDDTLVDYRNDVKITSDGRISICYGTEDGLYLLEEDGNRWRRQQVAEGDAEWCRLGLGPDDEIQLVFKRDGVTIHAR